ncbi:ATP-binding SpoIIE family protein phosphatase [Streptomyces sp. NRRL F-2664]|uniref:ATP-binding SpoIIE family protein phosphatase n=1 Tax=Streptomyces sp. NRRL F-2664 TaxID=1463842 RepID=UPI0005BB20D0|nr:SpoIIE family protein phosphatase [Streptomyces sp. NRRL F-2664]
MRTEDVLAAVATGLWRWDNAAGTVSLDGEAARLLGLPAEPVVLPEVAVRSRFHPVDWNEINGIVNLAVAEGTLAEARLRIMDVDGRVMRTVRSRSKPLERWSADGSPDYELIGTIQEIAEPQPGTTAAHTPITGDWRRSREAFLLDAGRALAEARSTAEVLPTPEDYKRRFPATWPLAQRFDRVSWAFLPLIVAGRTMGAWMAAFKQPASFSPDERSVLTTVARMLAQALQRAGVAESERELTTGLQRSMMPQLGPEIPGMRIAARYVPTGGGLQVGGDWYDMIPLPSGRFALVIGDVQGHDVRAAGLMGQLRIAVRAYASEGHRPDAVLSRASRFLAGLGASQDSAGEDQDAQGPRFATCLYVECDPATGTLEVARAGHPDPVVRMTDGTVLMRPTAGGLPLGIDPDTDYPTTRFTLEPGETMMLCTDGLIETGGHDLDTGWARLRAVLEADTHGAGGHDGGALDGRHLETLADLLVQAVHGPSSHHTTGPLADRREDDIAVVLLCREGAGCGCDTSAAHPVRPARRTMLTVAQAEPERIAGARRQVRELLHDWADEDQVDSAVLMVSEMVTNVLMHTDGDALLVAEAVGELGERRLRVEVADSSDELPHKRHPGEMASSGRGVLLTEMLADAWGVDPRGEGKSIWFELYEQAKRPEL